MKIYTEIVYTWNDNKGELVEESSKSYDYQGEVTLCDRKRYWHHHAASDALGIGNGGDNSWQNAGDSLGNIVNDIASTTWSTAETAAQAAQTASANAWSGMQDLGQDFWDKGAEGLSEMWEGTGLDADTVASWTDKAAMADSWMPGKWSADSSWQSKWMMGVDLRKANVGGFDWRDYKRDLYADFQTFTDNINNGVTAGIENIETNIEGAGDTLAVDEIIGGVAETATDVGESIGTTVEDLGSEISEGVENQVENVEDVLADNNEPLANLGDKIDANIAGINEDIETGIDENTDTLNQMEDTVNYNVDQGNAAFDNATSLINDVGAGINEHVLDPLLNIGNENSLIKNPTGWYENAFHDWSVTSTNDLPGGGGSFDEGLAEDFSESLGGVLGAEMENFGNTMGGILGNMWPSDGGESQLAASRRNMQGLEGDPFGNPSETRRLINQKRTFKTAPSLINA